MSLGKYVSRNKYNVVTEHKGESSELEGRKRTLLLESIKNMFVNNQEVKLRVKNDSKRMPTRVIEGKVIQKNEFLIAIKTSVRVETFNFVDFLTGRAKVIG